MDCPNGYFPFSLNVKENANLRFLRQKSRCESTKERLILQPVTSMRADWSFVFVGFANTRSKRISFSPPDLIEKQRDGSPLQSLQHRSARWFVRSTRQTENRDRADEMIDVDHLERVLLDHEKGKRHQALLNARDKFEKAQNASVYISRLQPQHDEQIFRTYFSQFGSIKNCFVDKEKVRRKGKKRDRRRISSCFFSTSTRSSNSIRRNRQRSV